MSKFKTIYAGLLKSLYGKMDSALLLWMKLSTGLDRWVFKMYLYNWYVMNKHIEVNQCTILCCVNDIKASHEDTNFMNNIINLINSVYIIQFPLSVTHVKAHNHHWFLREGEGKVHHV